MKSEGNGGKSNTPSPYKSDDSNNYDYSDYMSSKLEKLQEQIEFEPKSTIFKGLKFHINGYTNPTRTELRRMIYEHGGTTHHYDSAQVTYVIATNLAGTKISKLDKSKIVKPEFIVDCVRDVKLYDVHPYKLYTPNVLDPHQKSITSLLKRKNDSPEEDNERKRISVKEFHKNSRLHHLSTWKNELIELVANKFVKPIVDVHNKQRLVMHIDMDSFFVSVALSSRPNLVDKPVAVSHAAANDLTTSYSDLASCNYVARSFGIHNGMFIVHAVKKCPSLVILPYEFASYKEVSHKLYEILFRYADDIEAVSCDEAYIDVTSKNSGDASILAESIRKDIFEACKCTASIGMSHNRLLAR
jgi:DNA repair protein REV1